MSSLHGGDIYRNRNIAHDLSVNVNPLGMPGFVRRAAEESISRCECYPDVHCETLRNAVSSHTGVPEETIIFGNGAAELIYRIVQIKKPQKAVLPAPSFVEYRDALESVGCGISWFYLKEEDGFALPVDTYLEFLADEKPDMIFLCNPSNPVGNVIEKPGMERILAAAKKLGIFAVVDECFHEFLPECEKISVLDQVINGNRNLFVLQAPTKSFAMAGLRLGFGFAADAELIRKMEHGGQPWNVSIPAQAAGAASFLPERELFLNETRELIGRERDFLAGGLASSGFSVFRTEANYILFKDREEKPEKGFYQYCLRKGFLIRCCDNYEGLNGRFYRICIKDHEVNKKFLNIIAGYI